MNQKHFDAILAKNNIARELRDMLNGDVASISFMRSCLKDIEAYIGEGNQPSVEDIITCKEYRL